MLLYVQFQGRLGGILQIPRVYHTHGYSRHGSTHGFKATKEEVVHHGADIDLAVHVGFEFRCGKVSTGCIPQTPVTIVRTGKYLKRLIRRLFPNGNRRDRRILVVVIIVVVGWILLERGFGCGVHCCVQLHHVHKVTGRTTRTLSSPRKVTT